MVLVSLASLVLGGLGLLGKVAVVNSVVIIAQELALIFILYLFCAGKGYTIFKVVTAIISIFGSLLCLGLAGIR